MDPSRDRKSIVVFLFGNVIPVFVPLLKSNWNLCAFIFSLFHTHTLVSVCYSVRFLFLLLYMCCGWCCLRCISLRLLLVVYVCVNAGGKGAKFFFIFVLFFMRNLKVFHYAAFFLFRSCVEFYQNFFFRNFHICIQIELGFVGLEKSLERQEVFMPLILICAYFL